MLFAICSLGVPFCVLRAQWAGAVHLVCGGPRDSRLSRALPQVPNHQHVLRHRGLRCADSFLASNVVSRQLALLHSADCFGIGVALTSTAHRFTSAAFFAVLTDSLDSGCRLCDWS